MNAPPAKPGGWTGRRFWAMAGVFCLAQTGLIVLFASREQPRPITASEPGNFRLMGMPLTAGQLTKTFFAIDPTVFPLPGRHGFSQRAWLHRPMEQFEVPSEMEPPAWLALDAGRLGADFAPLSLAQSALPFDLKDQNASELEPWPVFLAPEQFRTQSAFEIRGELADRQLNAPLQLPVETNTELLSNSVVQIAVDSAGQVVAARLLAQSGSVDADNTALDKARSLRFRPAPSPGPVWGKAVFEWQTVGTNNPSPAGAL
jgi:hypothetical protein